MPHASLGVIPLAILSLYALAILKIELSVAATIRILATQAEQWSEGQVHQLGNLTHRRLMRERNGFGSNRWCRTIQGVYRSLRPELPPKHTPSRKNEAINEQLMILHSQLYALGDFTMYTDGGWEYGGDGMDAPFYPYTDSPSHKGGGSIVFITKDFARI